METINATPIEKFYMNELVAELTEFFILHTYPDENIYVESEDEVVYTDEIQEVYDFMYDKIHNFLNIIKI
jgi:CRISPR/Cas system-associated protein Cas5 (RAMP superfamily)